MTEDQIRAGIRAGVATLLALRDAVREAKRIPAGHLYAAVCGHMSLEDYQRAEALLLESGKVRKEGHELVWADPA